MVDIYYSEIIELNMFILVTLIVKIGLYIKFEIQSRGIIHVHALTYQSKTRSDTTKDQHHKKDSKTDKNNKTVRSTHRQIKMGNFKYISKAESKVCIHTLKLLYQNIKTTHHF